MLIYRAIARDWTATPYKGIERALLRNNQQGGRSSYVRLVAGACFPRHQHEGYEEILVISGSVQISDQELAQHDYLFTEAGEEHDVLALTDAVIFVSSEKATPVIDDD
ncbi:MAG TPA: cupin domain-containing protein [Methylophaga sp.]|nr:cupin domain-containing protein [Methylophaga sp.]